MRDSMNATSLIAFGTIAAISMMIEAALWYAFRMKAVPISFTHEKDSSSLRFFTFARLRLIVFVHTFFLLGGLLLLFFLLW